MKALQIEAIKAKQLYPSASKEFKAMLEDSFGKDFFTGKITDRVKTYEDACAELGLKPETNESLSNLGFTKDEIAYRKLKVIAKALNEGWIPDWSDDDQYKYYPWLIYFNSSSAFRFGVTSRTHTYTATNVGSRLCFKNSDLAAYAGTQFIDIYNDYFNL